MTHAVSKIGVFGLAALVLFLVNCGSSGSAIAYNDEIVKLQTNVIESVLDLVEAFKARQPEAMKAKLRLFQQEATRSANAVADMPGFEGDVALREVALELMEFYESVSQNEFATMIDILSKPDSAITEYDVERLKEIESQVSAEEKELDMKLQRVQDEFARKHNIRIKANKIQRKIDNLNR
jgi:hypothetical protein